MSTDQKVPTFLDRPFTRRSVLGLSVLTAAGILAACDKNPDTTPTQPTGEQATPDDTYERAVQGAEMIRTELGAIAQLAGDILRRDQAHAEVEDGRYFLYNRLRKLDDESVRTTKTHVPTVMIAYEAATRRLELQLYEAVGATDTESRVENHFELTAELPEGNAIEQARRLDGTLLEALAAELVPAGGRRTLIELSGGCGADGIVVVEPDNPPESDGVHGTQFRIEPQAGIYTIGVGRGDSHIANLYAPEDGEYPFATQAAHEAMLHARTALSKF